MAVPFTGCHERSCAPPRQPWSPATPTRRVPCTNPRCDQVSTGGRCELCRAEDEAQRGTARQRGYLGPGHRLRFRRPVLERDPTCTCTTSSHAWHGKRCFTPATVADHHPLSRRQLAERGMDPDDPSHGRGLCTRCHNASTAQHQPGGWNAR